MLVGKNNHLYVHNHPNLTLLHYNKTKCIHNKLLNTVLFGLMQYLFYILSVYETFSSVEIMDQKLSLAIP